MAHQNEKIVVLGADHNGVQLKRDVKEYLGAAGFLCIDVGPYDDQAKVDYVDYASTVAKIVDSREAGRGILICGTGMGMSMTANRFPNVRAALAHSEEVARKSREHNNANVLCLGAWVNTPEDNLRILGAWLGEQFGEGRHVRRVEKLKEHGKDKIVLTNGIFDIVHPGHIELLKFAKSLGGRLIVAINSDRATKELKGPSRPINGERDRKKVLEQLSFVDEVVIFDDTRTESVIATINPDVLVKGGEWTADEVRKRDRIPDHIEVVIFPLVMESAGKKYSTTGVIEKVRAQYGK